MRISDWSSDVCSSDLARLDLDVEAVVEQVLEREYLAGAQQRDAEADVQARGDLLADAEHAAAQGARLGHAGVVEADLRSEEHTSELQSLMRISYAVFCLKKKSKQQKNQTVNKEQNNNNHM